ncbi:MAG: 50S ribosomal protein L10 [Actinomycetota bacterium]|nr:50S ribosomal protein L10 [Actinomycetota bacterium]
MPRPDKTAAVAELTEAFRTSNAAVLTEYRGLTVGQLTELRRSLSDHAEYAVVKNTLTKIAAREAGVDAFEALLQGPSAIAFVSGDPVETAKGLRTFARAHPLLVIKGGLLEGRALSADEVNRLADLESREVLLARVAGGLNASLSRAAALFQAPLAQAARLAEALRHKAEQEPGTLAGGPGPAPSPEAAEAPIDEPVGATAIDSPDVISTDSTDGAPDAG